MRAALAAAALMAAAVAPAHAECGLGEPTCDVPLGAYRIALPEGDGPHPAVLFIHGFGASSESALRMGSAMVARGYAVIGPQGLQRDGGSGPTSWSFIPGRPQARDETAFFREVIDDAAARHGIDPARLLLTGYSIGGSLTSYIACETPGFARAYAPLAGAFWRPHPPLDGCAGPVDLFHTHGWVDGTVPIEGRPLGGGAIRQGDVFYAMQVWRETNGCTGLRPDRFDVGDLYWQRIWESCEAGSLRLALHPGGHGVPPGWADLVIDWAEGLSDRAIK